MAITRYGAQRFSGLAADVGSLPTASSDLVGAIFNSTDTLEFWIFNGTSWNKSAGGGGITGLNPNSTILAYETPAEVDVFDFYTTPTGATATTEAGGNIAANAIDKNTTTFWASDSLANQSITLDMGAPVNMYALAYFISTAELATMTETQFEIIADPIVSGSPVSVANLKAYYKFDETSGNLLNQAASAGSVDSNNVDLTNISGVTQGVTGVLGTAYDYDSIDGQSSDGAPSTDWEFMYNTTSGIFSFVGWVAQNVATEGGTNLILTNSDTANGTGILINLAGADANRALAIQITRTDSTDEFQTMAAGTFPSDTNFNMVFVSWDASDGSLQMSVNDGTKFTATTVLTGASGISDTPMTFGSVRATPIQMFNGDFDEFSFWDRVLTDAEVTLLFNGGAGTAIGLQTSPRIVRTVDKTALLPDVYNFIRFNGVQSQTLTIEGSSDSALVMAANELAVQLEPDPPLTTKHGQFTINATDAATTNASLNGGDPTSSVIDDPIVNTITGNNVGTPNDPTPNASIMWTEAIDATNDAVFAKVRVDNVYTTVQLAPAIAPATFKPAYQFAVIAGDLTVQTILNEWRIPEDFTALSSITAYLETAPVGSTATVEISKNATLEATLVFADGSKTASTATFVSGFIDAADIITVEITQIGSGTAGANLKISIIDGLQSSTKSIQFAATAAGVDLEVATVADVWRTPTLITTITQINAYVEVAPVGAAIILEVKKDGVTEGTITIADGAFTGSTAVLTSGTIDDTNEITVEITQVGSTTAGQNLKVNILGV